MVFHDLARPIPRSKSFEGHDFFKLTVWMFQCQLIWSILVPVGCIKDIWYMLMYIVGKYVGIVGKWMVTQNSFITFRPPQCG